MATNNKEIQKRSPKIKSTILQYLLVGLVAFPFLVWFAIGTSGKISDTLMIFIMCVIILAFWLAFIGIRHLYRKRANKIIQAKQTLRNSKTSYKRDEKVEANVSKEKKESESAESNVTTMKLKNTKGNK